MSESCSTCRHFFRTETVHTVGKCCRFPQHVQITLPHFCGEFSLVPPDDVVLSTDILLLQTSDYTRRVCKRLGLKTIQDVLDRGRSYILTNGQLDRIAITDLSNALKTLGIQW